MASASDFKIAILGAGPAGLTLASLLTASTHAFNFTVFERRDKPDPANVDIPSGSLDLQEEFGLAAVKACGLHSHFLEFDSGCTEQTKITDRNGTVLLDKVGEGRPEISRNALTQLLLSGVPPDKIRWNTKVLSVTPADGKEKGVVEFTDGKSPFLTETFDLIVGADGAWSRARTAIPGAAQPIYSGAIAVTLDVPNLQERHPDLDVLLGGGTFAACGDGKVLLTQRAPNHTARLYLFIHSNCQAETREQFKDSSHDGKFGPDPALTAHRLISTLPTNHKNLKDFLLSDPDFFPVWPENIKHLIAVTCDAQPADAKVDVAPLYMLPLDPFPHPHTPGLALVGDAAHLLTPFAGKGVNTAMADTMYLAKQLDALFSSASAEGTFEEKLDNALIAFEEESHAKGKAAMVLTWMSLLLSYEEGAPARLVKVMASK
ncbi:hypothetical protein BDV96DRAFT_580933 [Lophiotrema nucula]|uniref:FAD-binding domain-containing protein n=1 Tax=Lophiotrema nucula TaxID=690887 RepID=A0A6A5YZF3_9PLEO|nr:hypothetical protein BDV96DRAFT_580933 [Lophiotrema nucula]